MKRVLKRHRNLLLAVGIPLLATPVFLILAPALAKDGEVRWERLSSTRGDLPAPGTSREQTGDMVVRLDPDSPATDFVISFRVVGPALVWYRRNPKGWDRYIVEKEFLPIEAGF